MFGFRFIFVVVCFTAILILTVFLRSGNNHLFYRLCALRSEQSQLKQQLWHKQLRVESLLNPAAVSERLGQ